MNQNSKQIDAFMESKRKLIFNALSDDKIRALLLPYTYDEVKINEGAAIWQATDAACEQQKQEYAIQFAAMEVFNLAFDEANTMYLEHVGLTRLALEGFPTVRNVLGLRGKRPRRFATWLRSASRFYNNAIDNPDVLDKVAAFGLTNEMFMESRDKVKAVELANDEHDKARGEAQQATMDRNKAVKELEKWTAAFLKVCRYALKEKPQYLEKLGVVVLSEGYKRSTGTDTPNEEPGDPAGGEEPPVQP
jgi:hypothetical protein